MNRNDFDRFAWYLSDEYSFLNATMPDTPGYSEKKLESNPEDLVQEYPVLAAVDTVVFPHLAAPLFIGRESSRRALEAAQDHDSPLLVVAQRDLSIETPTVADLYTIGSEVTVGRVLRMPDGTQSLFCHGEYRVEILEIVHERPYLRVIGRRLLEPVVEQEETQALMRAVLILYEKIVLLSQIIPEEALVAAMNMDDPGWLSDLITSTLNITMVKRQQMLETLDPIQRLQQVSMLLAEELDVLELENQIQEQVQRSMDGSQREYFLREQMRAIQDELGEGDEFTQDLGELHDRIEESGFPDDVRSKAEKELARLGAMPPMAPETGVVRTYLEWLLDLPWGEPEADNTDVLHAERVLDEYHYGLEKAKERVIEHIAVRKLAADNMRTPILCFVGPPGTGKTSMGKSIAEALGRKFVRISLGGIRDEAEIRGHRRTYIGSMPGRVLQTMRNVGVSNPVFMLDEVDKMGFDFRGDPASALLEVLDPEQNYAFSDHYLEVPYDLSNVFFIATANNPYSIPHALARPHGSD